VDCGGPARTATVASAPKNGPFPVEDTVANAIARAMLAGDVEEAKRLAAAARAAGPALRVVK
jgi:hypothetical protein